MVQDYCFPSEELNNAKEEGKTVLKKEENPPA
jgi:hypothetical protein